MPPATTLSSRARRWGIAGAGLAIVLPMTLAPWPTAAHAEQRQSAGAVHSLVTPATAGVTLPRGWRRDMLARVNALRARVGAPRVRPCRALRRSAQDYATQMARTGIFDHVGPDGSEPWDRMSRQGYRWRHAAENIAAGQTSVDDVMRGWIESPGHYANMVDPVLRHIGFGFASDPRSPLGTYWVQNLARGAGC